MTSSIVPRSLPSSAAMRLITATSLPTNSPAVSTKDATDPPAATMSKTRLADEQRQFTGRRVVRAAADGRVHHVDVVRRRALGDGLDGVGAARSVQHQSRAG